MSAQSFAPELDVDIEIGALQRAMIRLAEVTGKKFAAVVLQNSRLIAWNLAHNSQPYGMTLAAKKTGEAAVLRDIGRVFSSGAAIFKQLKEQDEKLAKAFYKHLKGGGYGAAERLLRKQTSIQDRNAPIFAPLDPDLHQQSRNRRGRVNRHRAAQIVPDAKDIQRYAKSRALYVGFGKAGWITAGSQLGKITRVPAWITRHRGRAPGSALNATHRLTDPYVTLINAVGYASSILPDHEVADALRIQREKMLAHIEHVLVNSARESGFEARATAPSSALAA